MRVGVEVGGTFTDLVAIGPDGIKVTKVPSVPRSPDEGAFNALVESGLPLAGIEELAHGSTVATNAVLERRGGRIAFVTTEGFRDILLLQRHNRTNIYALEYQKPEPVVARSDSFEVAERLLADGQVLRALDETDVVDRLVPALREGGYEAVAVCLLNAYANPLHEQRLAELLREHLPAVFVTLSSDVTREFREYERASTTTLSAYVQPVIDRYIGRFEKRLQEAGFAGHFSVMQSNGGRLPAAAMRKTAVTALLSGPAAGVTGATRQAGRSGFQDLITLDIGGTSTDVCLVNEGKPELTSEYQIDGLPIRIPVLDINTVGAGGGSIVWLDEGGMLRVGPRSAGADPGPACYGRGGSLPTITDAHVLRQTVRPEVFLGGRMRLDLEAARRVFAPLAERLNMTLEEAADAAVQVANANIVRAIQLISTERGKDPRDYALVPFGGAGPLHAAQVAEDLGIRSIVVPPSAGVISAYGLIASDFVQFESLTRRAPLNETAGDLVRATFDEMQGRAATRFAEMGLAGRTAFTLVADMRFVGQAFEIPVEIRPEELSDMTVEELRRRFAAAHERIFFHGGGSRKPVEFVSFRLGAVLPLEALPLLRAAEDQGLPEQEIELYDDRRWQKGRLLGTARLRGRPPLEGPALLTDATSSLFVPAGWRAEMDDSDNVILRRI